MQFDDVVRDRRSVRAFRSDPVPAELIRELLQTACLAPSGTNIQPWKVHVVTGDTRRRLEEEVLAHRETRPDDDKAEFLRSSKRKEPYISRMRALGKDMYGRIGIPRGDEAASWRQWGRNYSFFDAPVGLIFTIDKELDSMSFLDIGMFMQTFMLAAKDRGLDTCAQGAWNLFWSRDAADPLDPRGRVHYCRHGAGLCRSRRSSERHDRAARAARPDSHVSHLIRAHPNCCGNDPEAPTPGPFSPSLRPIFIHRHATNLKHAPEWQK